MTYQFARINLEKTTYQPRVDWFYITEPNIAELQDIYRTYCIYKHFGSVMPLFDSQFTEPGMDLIGYRDQGELVAFSMMKRYDDKNLLAAQFAWNYRKPRLRLGIQVYKQSVQSTESEDLNTCIWIKRTVQTGP
jgi:hypothetical protein